MTYTVLVETLNPTHSLAVCGMSPACLYVCLYSYLVQILNETLRWAIIGPYAARVQDTDIVIAGHHIPAGVHLYTYYFARKEFISNVYISLVLADHTTYRLLA